MARPLFLLLMMQGAAALVVPTVWRPAVATLRSQQQLHTPAAVSRSGTSSVRCDMPEIDGTGAFKNIQEYPCDLDVKVIGNNEGPFVSDIVTLCAENTGMKEEDIQVRWRDKGKYRAITLRLHFENSDQVRHARPRRLKQLVLSMCDRLTPRARPRRVFCAGLCRLRCDGS